MSKVTNIVIINKTTYQLELIVKSLHNDQKTVSIEQVNCFAEVFKAKTYEPK